MSDVLGAFRSAVFEGLGNAPEVIEPGRFQRFATNGRPADKAGWSMMFDDLAGGVFGCFRQGIQETWTASDARPATKASRLAMASRLAEAVEERIRLRDREWAENASRFAEIASQCVVPTPGDPLMRYLERRQCLPDGALPPVLRLHPGLPYWEAGEPVGTFPTMIAPLVAPSGQVVCLHRTYLTDDGRKAPVQSPKKLTRAAGPLRGASIRLHGPVEGVLGIAEGIETAIAATCASGVPTVAAYCADALATWIWPQDLSLVVIFGDADKRGRAAVRALRQRAVDAGLRCRTLTPEVPGKDWCDVWAERCNARAARGEQA